MNKALPFFAYGFFKPGELAYYKIKNIVEKHPEASVKGALFDKDGLPILVDEGSCKEHKESIKGNILYFKKGKEETGYTAIDSIEPDSLYHWKVIETEDGIKVNALVAVQNVLEIITKEEQRTHSVRGGIELTIKRRTMEEYHSPYDSPEWHGYKDVLFNEGMCYLKHFIEKAQIEDTELLNAAKSDELRELHRLTPDVITLFKEQMAFTFLWTIIDRHNSMKYLIDTRNKLPEQREEFAKDSFFQEAVKLYVPKEDRKRMIVVNSSSPYTVRVNDSNENLRFYLSVIQYYYQIRCNVVHRGKAGVDLDEAELLHRALNQLYKIMDYMFKREFPPPKKKIDNRNNDFEAC
jgi:hypothetical protein